MKLTISRDKNAMDCLTRDFGYTPTLVSGNQVIYNIFFNDIDEILKSLQEKEINFSIGSNVKI